MENAEIAAVFNEMADLLDIQGGDRYRIRAFRRIGRVLENLRAPVPSMIRQGSLGRVPGIGEGAVGRIKEILRSGTCGEQRHLEATLPPGLRELLKVKGIGVKSVRHLYANERITSVAELEDAVRSGRVSKLPGFGHDSQEKILTAIARYRRETGRLLLPDALKIGGAMVEALRAESATVQAELTGSARRRKETVGDLDILVASHDPAPIVARFTVLPDVEDILVRGDSKCSALLRSGQQVDLRVIEPEAFGAGLHYFTGSQQHNIYIRARGNRRGIKISEHGVFRRMDEKLLDSAEAEAAIFTAVGLPYIPPELRENCGEIEAAEKGKLPALLTDRDVRSDVHVRTAGNPVAMIEAAKTFGLVWMAATDAPEEITPDRAATLRAAGKKAGVQVLAGVEVPILPDGTLAADPALLRDADFVIGAMQGALELPVQEQTARLIRAMESGVLDCIAHPAGRIFGDQDGANLDLETIFKAARRLDVALELNGDPRRLDLDSTSCRYAREVGVTIALGTGASMPEELVNRGWAIAVARRGWLEARDVMNSRPAKAVLEHRRARLRKRGVSVGAMPSLPELVANEEPVISTGPSFRQTQLDTLAAQLQMSPLPQDLLERLEEFFRSGSDEILEESLTRISAGRPTLQKAYELILANESGPAASAALQEEPGHEPAADEPATVALPPKKKARVPAAKKKTAVRAKPRRRRP